MEAGARLRDHPLAEGARRGLAAMGLYRVLAHTVAQRTREGG